MHDANQREGKGKLKQMAENPTNSINESSKNRKLDGEGFYKWLAGLVDSDGCISFWYELNKKYGYYILRMTLQVGSASVYDKDHKMLKYIQDTTQMGTFCEDSRIKNGSVYKVWKVQKTSDINKIMPRLIKHMIIKAKYSDYIYQTFLKFSGKHLTIEEVENLRKEAKEKRKIACPIKDKNYASWAWMAGYLDGDGCYSVQYRKDRPNPIINIQVVCHHNDKVGIEYLQKSLGGKISSHKGHLLRWRRSIGVESSTFAIKILRKFHKFSVLKKHKIECLLNFHSQRLNEFTPMGEVIVR
jgi:hypothetical protein